MRRQHLQRCPLRSASDQPFHEINCPDSACAQVLDQRIRTNLAGEKGLRRRSGLLCFFVEMGRCKNLQRAAPQFRIRALFRQHALAVRVGGNFGEMKHLLEELPVLGVFRHDSSSGRRESQRDCLTPGMLAGGG